jgi:hypothetical protein
VRWWARIATTWYWKYILKNKKSVIKTLISFLSHSSVNNLMKKCVSHFHARLTLRAVR